MFGKPQHGDLFLAESEEVLATRPDCEGGAVRGLKVEYVPQPGFAGGDRALYYIDNQRGQTRNYFQTIEVR